MPTIRLPLDLRSPISGSLQGNSYFTVVGLTDWEAGHWEFLENVDGKVYGIVTIPKNFTGTTKKIILSIGANATTGITRLSVATKAIADGESLNPAALTNETAQDITVPATARLRKDVTFDLTEAVAADDILLIEVFHEGAHANDTLAVKTELYEAWLEVEVTSSAGASGMTLTRINGSSGAAGVDYTVQNLTADSDDITSTTPSIIMTTTGVGIGTWKFKYTVIYQTAATTTGIGLAVNHTGTVGQFASHLKQANSIATATNGIGEDVVTAAAGNVYEARPESVKDTVSFKTVGVGNINTDIMAILEGLIVVTATGQLELKLSTEVSTSAVRLMADSCLELIKVE